MSDETSITEASVCTIQIDLGLMDSIANLIILHPKENIHVDFVIEQQLETSVTVMDEGPHMDLVGWKHYVSEWEKIERLDSHSFISSYVSSNRFPDVTKSEIIEAVKEQASSWLDDGYDIVDRWVRLAQQCNNVHEYPCSVSISLIRLRIKVNVKGEWKEIYQIELNVPMGC